MKFSIILKCYKIVISLYFEKPPSKNVLIENFIKILKIFVSLIIFKLRGPRVINHSKVEKQTMLIREFVVFWLGLCFNRTIINNFIDVFAIF